MEIIFFYLVALVVVASGLLVVFCKSPINSAIGLVNTFFCLAIFYVMLHAPFMAAIQVMVYAGAIMVLILFVIMLLNLPTEARRPGRGMIQGALGFLLAVALAGLLGVVMARGFESDGFTTASEGFGTAGALGMELFSSYFYPVEAVSLLLLVAMIGAVLLAKRRL